MEYHKRDFTITVWYFKPSGKFYTEGTFTGTFTNCGSERYPTCSMSEAKDYLYERCRRNGVLLPGLRTREWYGPALINCEYGFPVLLPKGIPG